MSSKTKRKMERKVGSGKKGTVDEEEYLLKSVTKLTVRFTTTRSKFPSHFLFDAKIDLLVQVKSRVSSHISSSSLPSIAMKG